MRPLKRAAVRGPKFKPSAETAAASAPETPVAGKPQIDRDGFPIIPIDHVKGGQTMAQFVSSLFGQTDHPIMDLTGLEGAYDFSVIFTAHWKTDLANMLTDEATAAGAPTIFDAVEKQ